jgi:DNA-directed RNA polymerase, mitochondrial
MTDLEARQHELESEMSALGTERFRRAVADAREAGHESQTRYGHHLIAWGVAGVADAIKATLHQAVLQPTRAAIATTYLRLLDAETLAFLGTKGVIEGLTRRRRVQSVAIRIGRSVEDEVRFQAFSRAEQTLNGEVKPLEAYVGVVVKNLNAQTSDYDHKRAVLLHSMQKLGVEWDEWPEAHVAHLGLKLIALVIQVTGVAEVVTTTTRKKSENYLAVTPKTTEWINGKVAWDEVLCPVFQPMVVPPKAWTGPTGGGYLRPWTGANKVVKTRNRPYMEELASTDQTLVYSSLNAIQGTPWKVQSDVLRVMTELWRSTNITFGKLPSREDEEKPVKPVDIDTNKEARREWRRKASKIILGNLKNASKRLMVDSILRTADKFKDFEAIYFPHNLDFRGRIYSIPAGLNPQGYDVAKGLLAFAKGKPLGDQRGADWLAIHGANLWGFDKVSLAERVQWVKDNEDAILGCAEAPLDCTWWTNADGGNKAVQFLAFCFEWAGYVREGFSFVSCQPIALDGSCNGLQHFSALLRDPIGGAATNLVPADKPNDIYQTVCDKTIEKLKADGSLMARQWLALGLTRKGVKRCVMVVPYGGTRHSSREYLFEHISERFKEPGTVNPWGEKREVRQACNFLSGFVWDAIRETVVAARDAMDWLQKVAAVVSKEEKPLNWTAPSGFKIQQAYPNVRARTIKTTIAGQVIQLNLQEDLPSLDKRRQAQGISPNFVHSLDAAALTFTVDSAVACGVDSFAMIHDSYGTLAADTDVLRECLRQAFCQMYQFDVLQSFADEIQKGLPEGVKLPPLPPKGSLDINQVLQSDFFFA